MHKKIIALLLSCVMLLSITPAVTAADVPAEPRPTVDEILNEYHKKSFEAALSTQTDTARTYTNRSGESSQTLEQETVDALTAAGYEAYNVTADNFDSLETSLETDFEKMGLTKDGSYIIVISGDHPSSSDNPNSRAVNLPSYDHIGDGAGAPNDFEHTYDGVTYTMRYVIVTGDKDSSFLQIGNNGNAINIHEKYDVDDMMANLSFPITVFSSLGLLPYTGTLYGLISLNMPNHTIGSTRSLTYLGSTNWTVTYIQILNPKTEDWVLAGGFEYVTATYSMTRAYYNTFTNRVEYEYADGEYCIEYSQNYSNTNYMKDMAALSYRYGCIWIDCVEFMEYKFDGETVLKHWRWMEPKDYDPT